MVSCDRQLKYCNFCHQRVRKKQVHFVGSLPQDQWYTATTNCNIAFFRHERARKENRALCGIITCQLLFTIILYINSISSTTLSLRASLTYHTMSCIWRPFDVEECGTSTTTQKKTRQKPPPQN